MDKNVEQKIQNLKTKLKRLLPNKSSIDIVLLRLNDGLYRTLVKIRAGRKEYFVKKEASEPLLSLSYAQTAIINQYQRRRY